MEDVMAPVMFFAFLGLWVYLYFTSRHKERMALIERGLDASLLMQKKEPGKYQALKWGLTIIFTGIGAMLGMLANPYVPEPDEGLFFVTFFTSSVLISAGLGLVIYYIIVRRWEKDETRAIDINI